MKFFIFSTVAALAFGLAASALAAPPPPQYKPEEVIKSFAPATAPEPSTGAVAACDNGEPRDDSGACPVLDDSPSTRGFSLVRSLPAGPQGGRPDSHSGSPAPSQHPAISTRGHSGPIAGGSPRPVAPAGHRDMLITFKVGSAELTDQAKSNASVFAKALGAPQLAGLRFQIEGHTDSSGSPEKNRILSKARADAVMAFLVSQGVDSARLQAIGFGSDKPLDGLDAKSPSNRRVEARKLD